MSLAILHSRATLGIEAPPVTIEVLLSGGLPAFSVVGLAETAVRESKDRVRGAIQCSRFDFPQRRITVSLGPADLRKSGGRFDLAIAVGVLMASGQLSGAGLDDVELYGELGLNGELRAVPGLLPAALRAKEAGRSLLVPSASVAEAQLAKAEVRCAATLLEVAAHINGSSVIAPLVPATTTFSKQPLRDIVDVRGQCRARRALEIAAAGGHHLLLTGPPGTGKSMLASRLPGLLPEMTDEEALQSATVSSVLGVPLDAARFRCRPFRSPHHSASAAALVGGGTDPMPGEVSRAHNGVLFLDELPEWQRHVLETLREPLEVGSITISRAGRQAEFPARFQFVGAMNPCPCGYLGDQTGDCHCSRDTVTRYRHKISGPLLDRIDIRVTMERPPVEALRPDAPKPESSKIVSVRVAQAQALQKRRAGALNATLDGATFDRDCRIDDEATAILEAAMVRFGMSVRAQRRVLRVARTVADLASQKRIETAHVAEALALRGVEGRRSP